jgi:hypothetical protein
LLSAAEVIPANDPHFKHGIEQLPNPTGEVKYTGFDCGEPADPLEFDSDLATVTSGPINMYWGFSCKSVGMESLDLEGRVLAGLTAGESAGLESAIWQGSDTGALMDLDTEIVSGTAVSLSRGIGLLEKYFWRNYGGTPVIHAPRELGAAAAEKHLIESAGGKLTTPLGSVWSFGNYPGTTIAGAAPAAGTVWIAASGQVQVHRGDIESYGVQWSTRGDGFDPRNNMIFMLAQRTDVVSWDGITAAVLVNL